MLCCAEMAMLKLQSGLVGLVWLLLAGSAAAGYYWKGLSFDEPNYLCYHFDDMCTNYLSKFLFLHALFSFGFHVIVHYCL
jgi:hypothetical protein